MDNRNIEIGYSKDEKIDGQEVDRQLSLTLENLRKMGITNEHKLVDYSAIVMNPAYVHITKRGQAVVEAFKKKLSERDVYTVGRYGDWKYCSIEDCMVDSLKVYESVKE